MVPLPRLRRDISNAGATIPALRQAPRSGPSRVCTALVHILVIGPAERRRNGNVDDVCESLLSTLG
jgi:hypothetical protein